MTVHEEPSGLDSGEPISIWVYIGCATSITPASMIPAKTHYVDAVTTSIVIPGYQPTPPTCADDHIVVAVT